MPPGRRRLAQAPRTVGAGWRQAVLGSRTSVRGEGGPRGGPGQRSTCCARARVPPHFTRPPGLRDRPGAPERAARRRRLPGQSGPNGRPPPTCVSSPGRLSSAGPIPGETLRKTCQHGEGRVAAQRPADRRVGDAARGQSTAGLPISRQRAAESSFPPRMLRVPGPRQVRREGSAPCSARASGPGRGAPRAPGVRVGEPRVFQGFG